MSSPTDDQVSVSQAWLDGVAATIESAVVALRPYIAQLVAGQSVTLNSADQANVQQALADLAGIEPHTPVQPDNNPPSDTPPADA